MKDPKTKMEERKAWNAPFLRAFQYLLDITVAKGKGELCALIGIDPSLISKYDKGEKKVSVETMNELACISKGKLNVHYMLGQSEFMLLENVPDDEILSYHNPDFEAQQRYKSSKEPIDHSSLVNAMIAAKDETIASLERELATKDKLIASLEEQLRMAKELLATYQHHTTPYSITPSEILKAAEDEDKDKDK